jgi:hypothetical protein
MSATKNKHEFTVQQLTTMDDRAYREAATLNLFHTGDWHGPFQQPSLIQRTLTQLTVHFNECERRLDARREDPNVPIERIEAGERFLDILDATIGIVEKRITTPRVNPVNERTLRAWRDFAHRLCDIVVDSDLEFELDNVRTPFNQTAREWVARRVEKDPSRALIYDDEPVAA